MSYSDFSSQAARDALDRHITGNWGADNEPEEGPPCSECGSRTYGGGGLYECEDCGHEMDEEPICSKPGRYGCGVCQGCEEWADRELDR